MRIIKQFLFLISISITTYCQAQTFSIIDAGELELGTNNIKVQGKVTEYFGMNVTGIGQSTIRVSTGEQSSTVAYEFKISSTRLYSYFFPNDLANLAEIFRRGVKGNITVEILNSDGTVADSTDLVLDVLLPKKNCKNLKSPQQCKKANLEKITKRQREKFVKAFVKSIRGPIVLEP